uniref:Uncharacterized protein AlNc14C72G4940 n=1 Tax=Albugo laibachii Nc14 TaxID=890382 RepID=F0WE85_9STRA|nr:conserved hypothetical protein [Albugo laibachii Nc14]|eukprot:CCA19514.1 conserved hypothetical protein [Albugo laibachii Nc14]
MIESCSKALYEACVDYEDLVEDTVEGMEKLDERVELALYRVDESLAVTNAATLGTDEIQQALESLQLDCEKLEKMFDKIDMMEEFVQRALITTQELEKRLEMIHNVANPLLQSGTVTNLMRSLISKKRNQEDRKPSALSAESSLEPIEIDLGAKEIIKRLASP